MDGFGTDTTGFVEKLSKIAGVHQLSSLLKVLLMQNGLDKPFTGGLGSFKLYVLVGLHTLRLYQIRDAQSVRNDLGHTLLTFLNFYSSRRRLNQSTVLNLYGVRVDFETNFKLHQVIKVFKKAYRRLVHFETRCKRSDRRFSALATVINAEKLKTDRQRAHSRAGITPDGNASADATINERVQYIQTHLLSIPKPLDLATIRKVNKTMAKKLEIALQRDLVRIVLQN